MRIHKIDMANPFNNSSTACVFSYSAQLSVYACYKLMLSLNCRLSAGSNICDICASSILLQQVPFSAGWFSIAVGLHRLSALNKSQLMEVYAIEKGV